MKLRTIFFSILLAIASIPAFAGGNHSHGHSHSHEPAAVNEDVAKDNASKVVSKLIEEKKLDESWSSIKATSVEKKMVNNKPEWVVTFVNNTVTDTTKQKLYIFHTAGGEYIAANFTGK